MRQERTTSCPICSVEVTVKQSRPGSDRKKYCESCKTHPMHHKYRQQAHKFKLNYEQLDKLYAITECQCRGKKLIDGQGQGHGGHNKRQIDHCHITGEIRGVLCWSCNTGIGKLGDSEIGLLKALDYLNKGIKL